MLRFRIPYAMRMHRLVTLLPVWLIVSTLLSACGGGGGEDGDTPQSQVPTISVFTVTPTGIEAGQSATLQWATQGADSVSISPSVGGVAGSGSRSVTPTVTTTYQLSASNSAGTSTAQVTVTVTAVAAPVISFAASPATISAGQSATLNWSTQNADSVSIDNGVGAQPTSGTLAVTPASTTTYTLTASGAGGSTTASTTVTVSTAPAPTVSFTATPETIGAGQIATLSWSTQNADSVTIDNGIGTVPTSGTFDVDPTVTTTFTLTASGAGGSVVDTVTVTVTHDPVPTVSFGSDADAVLAGESTSLRWTTSNADTVTLDNGLGAQPLSGSVTITPAQNTTYQLTASGSGGTTAAQTTVDVVSYDWTALATALDNAVGSGADQVGGYSFALNVAGRTVFRRGGGDLTQDSFVAIASATKAASAMAILTLVDAGLLDLDTPVSTYIGGVVNWPADKASITTRMLLNHSSGLPFDSPCLDDTATTLTACVAEIAALDLNFTPGSRFGYSGAGYQVAGLVAEQVSGQSWSTLFQQRITTPLEIGLFTYGNTQNPRIGGGAVTNARSYLKIAQMVLDGGTYNGSAVLSPASAQLLRNDQVAGLPLYFSPLPFGSSIHAYAFGWWISDASLHPGSIGPELSDPGKFGSLPWLDFDRRYAATLLLNADVQRGIALWDDARTAIIGQINQNGLPDEPAP